MSRTGQKCSIHFHQSGIFITKVEARNVSVSIMVTIKGRLLLTTTAQRECEVESVESPLLRWSSLMSPLLIVGYMDVI